VLFEFPLEGPLSELDPSRRFLHLLCSVKFFSEGFFSSSFLVGVKSL